MNNNTNEIIKLILNNNNLNVLFNELIKILRIEKNNFWENNKNWLLELIKINLNKFLKNKNNFNNIKNINDLKNQINMFIIKNIYDLNVKNINKNNNTNYHYQNNSFVNLRPTIQNNKSNFDVRNVNLNENNKEKPDFLKPIDSNSNLKKQDEINERFNKLSSLYSGNNNNNNNNNNNQQQTKLDYSNSTWQTKQNKNFIDSKFQYLSKEYNISHNNTSQGKPVFLESIESSIGKVDQGTIDQQVGLQLKNLKDIENKFFNNDLRVSNFEIFDEDFIDGVNYSWINEKLTITKE
jgi:hypothetical protein